MFEKSGNEVHDPIMRKERGFFSKEKKRKTNVNLNPSSYTGTRENPTRNYTTTQKNDVVNLKDNNKKSDDSIENREFSKKQRTVVEKLKKRADEIGIGQDLSDEELKSITKKYMKKQKKKNDNSTSNFIKMLIRVYIIYKLFEMFF